MKEELFIEIGSSYTNKAGQDICGDTIHSKKIEDEMRTITVLSDGLGSGVKANILANMTSHMALKFVESNMDLLRSSEVMMDALPICQVRRISYSTFTIVDCNINGKTKIIEMDNPPFIFIRNEKEQPIKNRQLTSPKWSERSLHVSQITTLPNDRIIFFSDGITQAGIGTTKYPLGWRREGCKRFALSLIKKRPTISARHLAQEIIEEAKRKEPNNTSGDDMSCAVIYFRKPRKLLLLSGPPYDIKKDKEYAEMVSLYQGKTAICGGTTANIIERELCLNCEIDKSSFDEKIPCASTMESVDLVTEGILTLTEVYRLLKHNISLKKDNAATRLARLIINSDNIDFIIGTQINNAHQDPNLPIELEIRRNIIKKIVRILKQNYLKEITIKYI